MSLPASSRAGTPTEGVEGPHEEEVDTPQETIVEPPSAPASPESHVSTRLKTLKIEEKFPSNPETPYCLWLSVVELKDGERSLPNPLVFNRDVLTDRYSHYVGAQLTEVCPISRDEAIIFCGSRSNGEGLTQQEAIHLSASLPPMVVWPTGAFMCQYEAVTVALGVKRLNTHERSLPQEERRRPGRPRTPLGISSPPVSPRRRGVPALVPPPPPVPAYISRWSHPIDLAGGYWSIPYQAAPMPPITATPYPAAWAQPANIPQPPPPVPVVREEDLERRGARLLDVNGREVDLEAYLRARGWKRQPAPDTGSHTIQVQGEERVKQYLQDLPPDRDQVPEVIPQGSPARSKKFAGPRPVDKRAGSRRKAHRVSSKGKKSSRTRLAEPSACAMGRCQGHSMLDCMRPAQTAASDSESDGASSITSHRTSYMDDEEHGSTPSGHTRRHLAHSSITLMPFDGSGPKAIDDYLAFKSDVLNALSIHPDAKVASHMLKVLKGNPGRIVRFTDPPYSARKFLEQLDKNYADTNDFVSATNRLAKLTKTPTMSINDYGAEITQAVLRLSKLGTGMTEEQKSATQKYSFYWGLPPDFRSQLAHFKDDATGTFDQMLTAAREIESHLTPEKDDKKEEDEKNKEQDKTPTKPNPTSGGGTTFGKNRFFPRNHLKGTNVTSHVASPMEDASMGATSDPLDYPTLASADDELTRVAELAAVRAIRDEIGQRNGNFTRSAPKKDLSDIECHVCGEKGHYARDCPYLPHVQQYIKSGGFLDKLKGDPGKDQTSPPKK